MRLLFVEDDRQLGQATAGALRDFYALDWVTSAEEAEEALATTSYDLIILDIGLPGKSGIDLLQQLRLRQDRTPVLMLTAQDGLHHRVAGLNSGADDYLVKPFELDELKARCAALMRRSNGHAMARITLGGLSYDLSSGHLEKDGQAVVLSARERAIFDCLIRSPNRVVAKEKIHNAVYDWGSDEIESNTIQVHIAALRRKLGRDTIQTIRGVGYMVKDGSSPL